MSTRQGRYMKRSIDGRIDSRSLSPDFLAANYSYEIQRTNNFQLEIYDLPLSGTEQIMLAVNSFSLPNITNDNIDVTHGNTDVSYASLAKYGGSGTLEIIDYITRDIEQIIDAWRAQVYDGYSDQIGWAKDYKKEGRIFQFGPDGTCIRSWMLKGLWPSGMDGGSLSYSGADVKKISVSIIYDKAFIEARSYGFTG